jgi:hypothetical protein
MKEEEKKYKKEDGKQAEEREKRSGREEYTEE